MCKVKNFEKMSPVTKKFICEIIKLQNKDVIDNLVKNNVIEDKIIKKYEKEDPDWAAFSFLGCSMGLDVDVLKHIKRMYDFGYTSAEQYWSEFEKKMNIEDKMKTINSMFPNTTPSELKGNLKFKVQDSLNKYYNQGYPFVIEWKEMQELEGKNEKG